MRIALIGAHGTGKTTLLKEIKKHIDLPVIPETARIVIKGMKKHPMQMSIREKLEFEQRILDLQIEYEDYYSDGFISDRSVLDVLAYCYLLGLHIHYPEETAEIEKNVRERMPLYTHLFHVQVNKDIPFHRDGVRFECENCRFLLDKFFCFLVPSFTDKNVYVVNCKELSERVKQVLTCLVKNNNHSLAINL